MAYFAAKLINDDVNDDVDYYPLRVITLTDIALRGLFGEANGNGAKAHSSGRAKAFKAASCTPWCR